MARILITGINGVVGTWLNAKLQARQHDIFGLDLDHAAGEAGWQQSMSLSAAAYSRCDIADFRQLSRIFEKYGPFDYVYNTAAEFGRWNGEDFYEQVWRTNAIGTKNIIRLQESLGFKLIHFSSSEVYGDIDAVMTESLMDEKPIRQLNDYALSKWVNETQIKNSITQFGTQSVIVRLFNTYGPGEWYHAYRSVNAKFCYAALHNLPVVVYKGHWRTSTYIEDCATTLANICDRFIPGEIYNLAGTEFHDIETLAQMIWQQSGADPKLMTTQDSEVLTTKLKRVDVSKAQRDLGMVETVSLETGISRTLEWMKAYYNLSSTR